MQIWHALIVSHFLALVLGWEHSECDCALLCCSGSGVAGAGAGDLTQREHSRYPGHSSGRAARIAHRRWIPGTAVSQRPGSGHVSSMAAWRESQVCAERYRNFSLSIKQNCSLSPDRFNSCVMFDKCLLMCTCFFWFTAVIYLGSQWQSCWWSIWNYWKIVALIPIWSIS